MEAKVFDLGDRKGDFQNDQLHLNPWISFTALNTGKHHLKYEFITKSGRTPQIDAQHSRLLDDSLGVCARLCQPHLAPRSAAVRGVLRGQQCGREPNCASRACHTSCSKLSPKTTRRLVANALSQMWPPVRTTAGRPFRPTDTSRNKLNRNKSKRCLHPLTGNRVVDIPFWTLGPCGLKPRPRRLCSI